MSTEKSQYLSPHLWSNFYKLTKIHTNIKSRSQVIETALQLLQQQELEAAYHDANREIEPDWEITAADGLADETW